MKEQPPSRQVNKRCQLISLRVHVMFFKEGARGQVNLDPMLQYVA